MSFRLEVMIDLRERLAWAPSKPKAVAQAFRILRDGFSEEASDGATVVYPASRVEHIKIEREIERARRKPRSKK